MIDGIDVVRVRTPTLPPATHTNSWIVGDSALSVFDPASPWEDEQDRLARDLRDRVARGATIERIVLTHHHPDHVGGATALQHALSDLCHVPIEAHSLTAELLAGQVTVDGFLGEGDQLVCGGVTLDIHHTPGHAPGHLIFVHQQTRAAIVGDMVAGVGTIAIAPEDGNLGAYLASLERMRTLDLTTLHPAHGPSLANPEAVLSHYIAHRHMRTDQIRAVLDKLGRATPLALAGVVYAELPIGFHGLAAIQVQSHLLWMQEHGMATVDGELWQST